MGSHRPISRIAIIGAGASGVTAAKYLLAENAFEVIDIFEQRDDIGGIWNLTSAKYAREIAIPQTNPRYGLESNHSGQHQKGHGDASDPELETPLYTTLETNIPHFLMAYSDKPFPGDTPLFPKHEIVMKYLKEYAEEVRHLIHFRTRVLDVRLRNKAQSSADQWDVTTKNLDSGVPFRATYDAVVSANGHHTVPYVPRIAGVQVWNKTYPGTIIHSKAYRDPEEYRNKKVLVIGNSASGVDIGSQIRRVCTLPLLLSSRSESPFFQTTASWKRDVPEITEFLDPSLYDRAVRFVDGNVESTIDSVIFATGYFYSFPFLSNLRPPVITDGLRTREVYQHLFHIDHPTLAFPVLNFKVIPFPLSENQAAVMARIWSGRLTLPSKAEMREWEQDVIAELGDERQFHVLGNPRDSEFSNELYRWAETARPMAGHRGKGKLGRFCSDRDIWMRSKFPELKKSYMERGDERFKVRTVEELGFDFEKWKKEQELLESVEN